MAAGGPSPCRAETGRGARRRGAGVGPTIHVAPKLECSGTLCGGAGSVGLDTAFGAIAQLAVDLPSGDRGAEVGIRYTSIDYSYEGTEIADGSSVGVFFGGWL